MSNERPVQPTDPGWQPKRVLLILAVAAQLLVVAVAIWVSGNLPPAPVTQPVLVKEVLVPEDLVFDDTEVAPRPGKQLPPIDVQKAAAHTPEKVKSGGQFFAQHCSSCHGQGGGGNGPASTGLNPKPRNLTSVQAWKNGTRLSDVFRTVSNGLQGTSMPAFDYLSSDQRFALAHFVLSLAPGHAADSPESLAQLDSDFSLAAGAKEPNTVPVSKAIERLVAEDSAVRGSSAGFLDAVKGKAGSPDADGAALLASLVAPDQAAAAFNILKNDRSWRTDPDRLRQVISANAGANGFLPRTIGLSTGEWQRLHAFLLSALPEQSPAAPPLAATTRKPGI